MKKTVSPYVNASNWDLCREFGYNMSEEIDKLMEILIATALDIKDEEGKVIMTRRIRLERQIELLDNKKDQLAKELEIATEQEIRFKAKLKSIEENRIYTDLIKDLNEVVLENGYRIKKILEDERAIEIMKKLEDTGLWTNSSLPAHVSRFRKLVEGF